MANRLSDHCDPPTASRGRVDCCSNLGSSYRLDLSGADWADPDRSASHDPSEVGPFAFLGLEHIDFPAILANVAHADLQTVTRERRSGCCLFCPLRINIVLDDDFPGFDIEIGRAHV